VSRSPIIDEALVRAECILLSGLMNGLDDLSVDADDLSSVSRIIHNRIRRLKKHRNFVAVADALERHGELAKVGGRGRIAEISNLPHDPDSTAYALDVIRDASRERQAAKIGQQLGKGEIGFVEALERLEKLNQYRAEEKSWDTALVKSVVTSRELGELALTPRKKLLDDWMCEGDLGFVFAFRGVGKTWFGLAIAQALSTAGKLGEWKAPEVVTVLYVDGEMPPDLMNNRATGLEKDNDHLLFLNHLILFDRTGLVLNIINRDVQEGLTAYCLAHSVKVLILDNLSTLASGMKENEADAWELVNTWLLDLRRRGIAVIIIHHAGRSGQMRGTSRREDNVFWVIALDDIKKDAKEKRGARFISHFTKPSRNTQHDVPSYQWHFVTESTGEVTISHALAQTVDVFLRVIDSGVNKHDEIADAMKLPGYEVSRMAKKAEDEGWLTRPKRGEYCLTLEGKGRLS
jgi:hypothetical protein